MKKTVNIATDFTRQPGLRTPEQTPGTSGLEFREHILKPILTEILAGHGTLTVDLSGTSGFPPSFLEEAFGGLVREFGYDTVSDVLELIGDASSQKWVDRAKRLMIRARGQAEEKRKYTPW